jgi:hypothetical protein
MALFDKLMGEMDARSGRGVFSRGKPVYRGGFNSPTPVGRDPRKSMKKNDPQLMRQAIMERIRGSRVN